MTYTDTPAATTIAIANACPFIAARSRNNFRFSAEIAKRHHHDSVARRDLRRVHFDRRHATVGEPDHAIGHLRDRRVVGDHDRRRAQLGVHLRQRLEHDDARGDVQRAGRLVAQQNGRPLRDRASDRDPLLFAARELCRESAWRAVRD